MGSTLQENLRYQVHPMKKTERSRSLDYRRLGQAAGGIATTLRRIHVWESSGSSRISSARPRRMTPLKIQSGHETRRSGHEMSCKRHLPRRGMHYLTTVRRTKTTMTTCSWTKMTTK